MNNVVFQVNIKGHRAKKEFEYSTQSWAKWCKKNNYSHFVLEEPIQNLEYMNANWHKFYIFEMLDNEDIDYDSVCIVDADTIVHPDCPNFFEMVDDKFTTVLTDGDYEWVNRAINGYSKMFFNKDYCIPSYEFFQTGFVIINKKHKEFFDKVFEFYQSNSKMIIIIF